MSITNRALIAHSLPLRLTIEEMASPTDVIDGFFRCFDMEDCRDILWLVFMQVLTLDDLTVPSSARTREEILLLYTELERLIEACLIITKKTVSNETLQS
jgi:hypothetical protein